MFNMTSWRRGRRLAATSFFACTFASATEAKAVEHQVCLYLDIGDEFWDASPRAFDGRDFREEYGRNEGDTSYPAQRWLARITHDKTGTIGFGWAPLDGNGCATVDVPNLASDLTIQWMRWAHWESTGNQLVGYDCEPTMTSCELSPLSSSFSPSLSKETTDIIVSYGKDDDEVPRDTVQWAASFAEERFSSIGENTLTDTRVYAAYDEADVLPGAVNQNDRNFGNQPGFSIFDCRCWLPPQVDGRSRVRPRADE